MHIYSTIIQPVTTEKSSKEQINGKYTFLVKKTSSKTHIRQAIEEIYGVKVAKITTSILPSKIRLVGRGRALTKRPVLKKAIITLKDGKKIDPNKIGTKTKSKSKK